MRVFLILCWKLGSGFTWIQFPVVPTEKTVSNDVFVDNIKWCNITGLIITYYVNLT